MRSSLTLALVVVLVAAAIAGILVLTEGDGPGAAGAPLPAVAGAVSVQNERGEPPGEVQEIAPSSAREALEGAAPADEDAGMSAGTGTALIEVLVLSSTTGEPLEGLEIELSTMAPPGHVSGAALRAWTPSPSPAKRSG